MYIKEKSGSHVSIECIGKILEIEITGSGESGVITISSLRGVAGTSMYQKKITNFRNSETLIDTILRLNKEDKVYELHDLVDMANKTDADNKRMIADQTPAEAAVQKPTPDRSLSRTL